MQSESLARGEPRTLVAVHLNTEVSGHGWRILKRWEHLERLERTFLKHLNGAKRLNGLNDLNVREYQYSHRNYVQPKVYRPQRRTWESTGCALP